MGVEKGVLQRVDGTTPSTWRGDGNCTWTVWGTPEDERPRRRVTHTRESPRGPVPRRRHVEDVASTRVGRAGSGPTRRSPGSTSPFGLGDVPSLIGPGRRTTTTREVPDLLARSRGRVPRPNVLPLTVWCPPTIPRPSRTTSVPISLLGFLPRPLLDGGLRATRSRTRNLLQSLSSFMEFLSSWFTLVPLRESLVDGLTGRFSGQGLCYDETIGVEGREGRGVRST